MTSGCLFLGQDGLTSMSAAVAGGVIASQIGYGIAAFGLGPLLDAGLTDLGSATDG